MVLIQVTTIFSELKTAKSSSISISSPYHFYFVLYCFIGFSCTNITGVHLGNVKIIVAFSEA